MTDPKYRIDDIVLFSFVNSDRGGRTVAKINRIDWIRDDVWFYHFVGIFDGCFEDEIIKKIETNKKYD